MNEIVKYNNYMNSLVFKKFKAVELDLLMVLCNRLRNNGTNTIVLSFSELKKLSGDTKHGNKEYINSLKSMNKKLMDIICEIEVDGKIVMFVLFPTFEIDSLNETLTVCVNERFKFILNEITKNFTRFELHEFVGLNSKYSKNLYRLLKQFKTTGKYEVSLKEFREKMDCPESYDNKYVMDLIIKPSLQELKKYFQNLTCEPKYAAKRGRPVTGYIFTFTSEQAKSKESHSSNYKKVDVEQKPAGYYTSFKQREYDYEALEKEIFRQRFSGLT